jgi:hypothetical protein
MNHHVYLFCSNSMNHRCSKKPCFLGFSSVPCCFFKGQTVLSHGCRYATAVSPCEVSPCGKRNPRRKRKDRWRTSWRRRRCRRLAEVQRFFFATSQLQKLDLKIFKIFNQSRNIVTLEIYSIYISYHITFCCVVSHIPCAIFQSQRLRRLAAGWGRPLSARPEAL